MKQQPNIVVRLSHRHGIRIVGGKNGGATFESDQTDDLVVVHEGWDWAAVENSDGERVYFYGLEEGPPKAIREAGH